MVLTGGAWLTRYKLTSVYSSKEDTLLFVESESGDLNMMNTPFAENFPQELEYVSHSHCISLSVDLMCLSGWLAGWL